MLELTWKDKLEDICARILEVEAEFYDDSNGPYYSICPLCGGRESYRGNEPSKSISDISHDVDCLRAIAGNTLKEIHE